MSIKLIKNAFIYGAGSQITVLINVLMLPILNNHLTETDYGVYGTITAYVATIAIFSTLGTKVYINNIFFKSPYQYRWGWRQLFGFLNLWNIPYGVLLSLIVYFSIPEVASENAFSIVLLNIIPILFFGQTATFGRAYYHLSNRPIPIVWRTLVASTIAIVLNYILIVKYQMGYMGWFWSSAISISITNLLFLQTVIKNNLFPIFKFKKKTIKHALKISFPTIPSSYTSFLMNGANQVSLNQLNVNIDDIGRYNVVDNISKLGGLINMAFDQATGPLYLKNLRDKKTFENEKLINTNFFIYALICFTIAIWCKEFFIIMFKKESMYADYAFGVIVIMAQLYRPMYLAVNLNLTYAEKTKLTWRISFVSGLINVILVCCMVPIFGYKAVFFCTFFAYLIMGYMGHFLPKFQKYNNININKYRFLFIHLVLTGSAFLIVEYDIIIKAIISIIALFITLKIFLRLNKT